LPIRGSASSQEVEKLNRFLQQSGSADKAMRLFTEARDLIDDDDWEGAEKAFRRFIDSYPKHKNVDAALYYIALSLKKQEKLGQAEGVIEWLLSHYPNSSWVDDAKNLRVEIAAMAGDGHAIEQGLNKDDLETKVIALQALFQGNPERGAQIVAEMLKQDSKSNARLKEVAISLLGQHPSKEGVELLLNVARNEKDARLRRSALFWLGQSGDERALDLLKELARSDDAEMSRTAIAALGQHQSQQARAFLSETARTATSIRARKEAIFWLAQSGGEEAVDELIKIYDADSNLEIRKQIIFALSQHSGARGRAKILEIARAGDDELRKQAIFWLGQRRDDQTYDLLAQLYDSEKDEGVKRQIIFSLAQMGSKQAVRKLIDIAKGDPSTTLRKEAIFWIGQSKDPEALKFLEEILK
jgi:HEAT repeat protein